MMVFYQIDKLKDFINLDMLNIVYLHKQYHVVMGINLIPIYQQILLLFVHLSFMFQLIYIRIIYFLLLILFMNFKILQH